MYISIQIKFFYALDLNSWYKTLYNSRFGRSKGVAHLPLSFNMISCKLYTLTAGTTWLVSYSPSDDIIPSPFNFLVHQGRRRSCKQCHLDIHDNDARERAPVLLEPPPSPFHPHLHSQTPMHKSINFFNYDNLTLSVNLGTQKIIILGLIRLVTGIDKDLIKDP